MWPSHARVTGAGPVSLERRAAALHRLLGAVAVRAVAAIDLDLAGRRARGRLDHLRDFDNGPSSSRALVTATPERSRSELSDRSRRYTKTIDISSQNVNTRVKRTCEGVGLAKPSGSQI